MGTLHRMIFKFLFLTFFSSFVVDARVALPTQAKYEVLGDMPVSDTVCMEGLFFKDGYLYQSNGWYGESALVRIDPENGDEMIRHDLESEFFAEGIAAVGNNIYQLTYTKQTCFIYEEIDGEFRVIGQHKYSNKEGWGLTYDGTHLIMSDSTEKLYFRDPSTFEVVKTVTVKDAVDNHVTWINELEFVKGKLLANHFMTQYLYIINPSSGKIDFYIDLSKLNPNRYPGCKCRCGPPTANGVAYDEDNDILWVSGKDWKYYYRIKLTLPTGLVIGAGGE